MTDEEKKLITQEKHPERVARGHKPAALKKKRKEKILCNKEQPTVQSTEQSTKQSTVHSLVQPSVQSTVQSNDAYVYGVGILAVLSIDVCVFLAYNTFQRKDKKLANEKKDQPPKRRLMLLKNIQ